MIRREILNRIAVRATVRELFVPESMLHQD
jgi:hypothetical protein